MIEDLKGQIEDLDALRKDSSQDELVRDAARYRWLRERTAMKQLFRTLDNWQGISFGYWPDRRQDEDMDTAIDAAMQGKTE